MKGLESDSFVGSPQSQPDCRVDDCEEASNYFYSLKRGWIINPAKLIALNFQPLEVVFRFRDPQLQEADNYSYLFNMSINICKYWCLDIHLILDNSDLVD